ncbi:hypothetical protein ABH947_000069 [Bacillus sp. RC206]
MDKIIANNSIPKSEYWELITSTLSSYEVKDISNDGTVKRRLVKDDYFLVNDVWDVNDIGRIPNFEEQFNKFNRTGRYIKFCIENHNIDLELKFVFYHKLFNDDLSLSSLFNNYKTYVKRLVVFLNEKYSHLHSLLELDIEKTEKQWIWWLNNKGVTTTAKSKNPLYGELDNKTAIANFFRSIYEKLFTLTDTREEWEKDRWDIRLLNANYGLKYNTSITNYFIDFSNIENVVFEQCFKKYIKTRLLGGKNFSWSSARHCTIAVHFQCF